MTPSDDTRALEAFFSSAGRRVALVRLAQGSAAGFALASAGTLAWPPAQRVLAPILASALLVALGGAAGVAFTRRRRGGVAGAVEQRSPGCRNLLVTAHELMARPPADEGARRAMHAAPASGGGCPESNTSRYVRSVVLREAARVAAGLRAADLFPARRSLAALVLAILFWALALDRSAAASRNVAGAVAAGDLISRVDIAITPPAYAGRPARSLRDPSRIEALAGSRVHVTVHGNAAGVAMETIAGQHALDATDAGAFSGEVVADADGFIALEPAARDGAAGPRRLIGLSVIADRAPRVRITSPGKDVLLPDGRRTIELGVEADDDLGLGTLTLRFTRVAGSGEVYRFTEGEVPLVLERTNARAWRAHASWRLDSLKLEPGDMVVYRAAASDLRPGTPATESDSYIAEVLAPGGVAAAGFALDVEEQRYALSQQMVILKTQRLLARKDVLAADAYTESAADISAEQRRVRAEFVFMMGGEMSAFGAADASLGDLNEADEAAAEDDIAAGRFANQGYRALLLAVRRMSLASRSLNAAEVSPALAHERAALVHLQRAFSHSRLILRALTQSERVDFSRRLTGALADAARGSLPSAEPPVDERVAVLRGVLAGVTELAGGERLPPPGAARQSIEPAARPLGGSAGRVSDLAERVLRLDPSAAAFQEVSRTLGQASAALGRSRDDEAHRLLERAAFDIAGVLRSLLRAAPSTAPSAESGILRGALTDALRRAPRGRP